VIIEGGFTTGRDTEVKPLFLCNENILTLATKIRFQYNETKRSIAEKRRMRRQTDCLGEGINNRRLKEVWR
jgi:hypothetical protein